jgi:ankyrin repeat protein
MLRSIILKSKEAILINKEIAKAEKFEKELKEAKEKQKAEAKFRRKNILINHIKYLSSNGISIREYLDNDPFPTKPFELRGSEEFFDYVKFNNYDLVKQALNKSTKYLYQFDYFKQTAFHWAAKLGYDKMLDMFLRCSRRCNVYDKHMRTPLYIAALNNQKKCVELLLDKGGNPFLTDIDGKKPEDVTTNTDIKILLQTTAEKPFNELNKEVNQKKYEENIIIM